MKIIIDTTLGTDNVTSITADSADANFPAANLQNDWTTDVWQAVAGITTATLTLNVSKGCAVEILNTNATSATVLVGTGGTYALESGFSLEAGYSLQADGSFVTTVYNLPGAAGRIWADYGLYTGPHIVTVTLTASSTVNAGIARAGNVEAFNDPMWGIVEASKDYSIEKELNNGSDYFRKRGIVRTFDSISIIDTRANAYHFKHDIWDMVGPKPLAVRLAANAITDKEWVLFCKRIDAPKITYDVGPINARITFNLKEVI
jgi:hypothetical protein